VLGEAELADEEVLLVDERARLDASRAFSRKRLPVRPRHRAHVQGHG
jgi:hypothetical protein